MKKILETVGTIMVSMTLEFIISHQSCWPMTILALEQKNRDTQEASIISRRSVSHREIKQRVHETASEHFLQFGFSKVTMNEIAEELGMSKKTPYDFFPGKESPLAEAVKRTPNSGFCIFLLFFLYSFRS